jgi:hypothetical protein
MVEMINIYFQLFSFTVGDYLKTSLPLPGIGSPRAPLPLGRGTSASFLNRYSRRHPRISSHAVVLLRASDIMTAAAYKYVEMTTHSSI